MAARARICFVALVTNHFLPLKPEAGTLALGELRRCRTCHKPFPTIETFVFTGEGWYNFIVALVTNHFLPLKRRLFVA